MGLNLKHIAEGWGKTLGLLEISDDNRKLSAERFNKCADCEYAKESKALEIIKGSIEKIDTLYCTQCSCPCHEKSLVIKEYCPLGKW